MDVKETYKRIGSVLFSEDDIQNRVQQLARKIENDFSDEPVLLVSNLKGSFRFLSDLCGALNIPVEIDFISFASYQGGTESSGHIRIVKDLKIDMTGKNVILVEDIVDTGWTVDYILKYFKELHQPKEFRICTLLDKICKRCVEVPVYYRGFEIEDKFVIGYGLDYKEYFRELNYIAEYHESTGQVPELAELK